MKVLKKLALVVALCSLFTLPTAAESKMPNDFLDDFYELVGGESTSTDELISSVGFDALLRELFAAFSGHGGEVASFLLLLLGLGLALALCEVFGELSGEFSALIRSSVSVVAALLSFSRLYPLVSATAEALGELSSFFSALVPIVTGLTLCGGGASTAATQAVNMNVTLWLLGKMSSELLMPLVSVGFALSLVAPSASNGTATFARGVRSVFAWCLGLLSAVLLAAVSLQSFLASSADSAALRAAKYAVSGAIPIVGSTVSSTLATLGGAVSYASATVGVGAVSVVIATAASPLVLLLLYRLCLSAATSFLGFVAPRAALGSFEALRSALDALISVYVVSVLIYVIELIVFMKSGVVLGG